jgi:hypothetical protein
MVASPFCSAWSELRKTLAPELDQSVYERILSRMLYRTDLIGAMSTALTMLEHAAMTKTKAKLL